MKNLINANITNSRAVRVNNVYVGSRAQMNISGSVVTAVDDPDGNEIDLTISSSSTTTVGSLKSTLILHSASPSSDGGTAASGSWGVRPLTSTLFDDIGVTLSSSQVILESGDYEVEIWQEFYSTGPTNCRLFNVSDSSVISTVVFQSQWINPDQRATLNGKGRFSIPSTKSIRLEYYVGITSPLVGLGMAADNGLSINQVYAMLTIKKLENP